MIQFNKKSWTNIDFRTRCYIICLCSCCNLLKNIFSLSMLFWNKSGLEFSKCSIQLPYYKPANKFDLVKVHKMQLDHIRFAKSPLYFWPIWSQWIKFLVLELYSLRSAKSYQSLPFLDTDKFVLSFLLISHKEQLCRI